MSKKSWLVLCLLGAGALLVLLSAAECWAGRWSDRSAARNGSNWK